MIEISLSSSSTTYYEVDFFESFALAYAHPNGFDQPCKPGEHCPRHKDPTCPPGKPCPRQNPEPSPRTGGTENDAKRKMDPKGKKEYGPIFQISKKLSKKMDTKLKN